MPQIALHSTYTHIFSPIRLLVKWPVRASLCWTICQDFLAGLSAMWHDLRHHFLLFRWSVCAVCFVFYRVLYCWFAQTFAGLAWTLALWPIGGGRIILVGRSKDIICCLLFWEISENSPSFLPWSGICGVLIKWPHVTYQGPPPGKARSLEYPIEDTVLSDCTNVKVSLGQYLCPI